MCYALSVAKCLFSEPAPDDLEGFSISVQGDSEDIGARGGAGQMSADLLL